MIFDSKKYKFKTYISENMYRDQNNFLVCENCIMGRTGVQRYGAKELGLKDKTGIIEVHRLEKDVFDEESLQSLEGRPFTHEHVYEEGGVNISNYSKYSKGQVFGVYREGNNIVGNIRVCDEETAKLIEDHKVRELSLGYQQKLCYDESNDMYSFTDIIYNHLALVKKGRAGNAMIFDSEMEEEMVLENENVEKTTEEVVEETQINDTSTTEEVVENQPKIEENQEIKVVKEEIIVKQNEEIIVTNDSVEDVVKEEITKEGEKQMEDKVIIKDTAYFLEKQKEIASLPDGETKKMLAKSLEIEMKKVINDSAEKPEPDIVVETVVNDSEEEVGYDSHSDEMQAFFDKFNPHIYPSEKEYEQSLREICMTEPTSKYVRKLRVKK